MERVTHSRKKLVKKPLKVAKKPDKAALVSVGKATEVVISFDTTGSMRSCIGDVRNKLTMSVREWFKDIPGLRVGVIAHGDYCDREHCIDVLKLTDDVDAVANFIQRTPNTGGGDEPECYELVLHQAQDMGWSNKKKSGCAFVMVGDATPHEVGYRCGATENLLDWRRELQKLLAAGVKAYVVQCQYNPGYRTSNDFWGEIAKTSGTPLIKLEQFTESAVTLGAYVHATAGAESLTRYASCLEDRGLMSRGVACAVSALSGHTIKVGDRETFVGATARSEFRPIDPKNFKKWPVPSLSKEELAIKSFCEGRMSDPYQKGWAFYQLVKPVVVQDYKKVVVIHKETGDIFTGANARRALSLPETGTVKLDPVRDAKFDFFIQSTSVNRQLVPGTRVLYGNPNA